MLVGGGFRCVFLLFTPYLRKWSNLTHMFQIGWFNHKIIVGASLMTLDIQGHLLRFGTWTPKTYHPNTVNLRRYSPGCLLVSFWYRICRLRRSMPFPWAPKVLGFQHPRGVQSPETKRRLYLGAMMFPFSGEGEWLDPYRVWYRQETPGVEIRSGFQVSAPKRFETGWKNFISFKHQVFLERHVGFSWAHDFAVPLQKTQNFCTCFHFWTSRHNNLHLGRRASYKHLGMTTCDVYKTLSLKEMWVDYEPFLGVAFP